MDFAIYAQKVTTFREVRVVSDERTATNRKIESIEPSRRSHQ
jgi:hypothetical protein